MGKEAREPGDGKGEGRKRSPSSACPCDRLPGLQIPAWDPHPCSPPPGLRGGGAPAKEGSPARQDPAHPARHSRSPQGHTCWTRSRPRPLSHAVDQQGLTHTPDPAHTRCHAEPDTHGGKALRGPRCTGRVDDQMPARPSGPGPRSAGARPQAPQTPARVPAARLRRGGTLGLGSGRDFRRGPAPPLSAG